MTTPQLPSDSGVAYRCADAWDNDRLQSLADRLRALADPTRLRLLIALQAAPEQQACVQQLTLAARLPQPTVSHHLQVLHRAALVTRTRRGSRIFYSPASRTLADVAQDLTPTTAGPALRRSAPDSGK